MESNTADEAADRALSSVSRKLDKSLSVEYTVNQLVADAMDSVNLSHMYSGKAASNFMGIRKLTTATGWGPHF
jgi:ataxia telangiectasia mutated family protein